MDNKTIYFPGLNGLRAIAAIAVVIGHITGSLKDFSLNPYLLGHIKDGSPRGYALGGHGVTIFFVLSGFLITYLLLAEKEKLHIDVRKFYVRRLLRIWPLYYLYLIIVVVTILIYGLDLNLNSLFFYMFYAANIPFITGASIPLLNHYWSLGVEEQFYLFWPLLIGKLKDKSMLIVLITTVFVLIVIRYLLHFFTPGSIWEVILHVTRFHCMMIGGIGAVLLKHKNKLFIYLIDNKIIQLFCWLLIIALALNFELFPSILGPEVISLVALFIIIGQIGVKNRIVNLELSIFDFLGRISYGMYVIHMIVIFFLSKLLVGVVIGDTFKYVVVYVTTLSITIALAYLSYQYFEKHFLTLKQKFVVVKSKASR